ncbi:MgtC/SapB family protein [Streptomyces sp. ML-6]|uniref:MgtC/SapB family protein n=1 Tax=Streptomyces sp. ML-6 TaxID=2982693 RepID=UPI0024C0E192|nr:MgtC/SapB family protein [Streptomyces sp. ML-6]MDK0520111.1 MgtC/SapB family protein [Streptomyces sp. ML-6]
MQSLTTFNFILRLATGVGCGALIGMERQWRYRIAGLRTNALVAAGAALFVLYSEAIDDPNSPTRVASYVVSGIGFIGGGVILREGGDVRGLNTAATLWCSAAAGVLAASGRLTLALLGAGAVVTIHLILRPASRLIDRTPQSNADTATRATFHVICDRRDEPHVRVLLIQLLSSTTPRLTGLHIRHDREDITAMEATVSIDGAPGEPMEQLVTRLSLEPGVRDLHWHLTDHDDQARADCEILA